MAPRYVGTELIQFVESKLETWLGLEINREKTRVVNLREEAWIFWDYVPLLRRPERARVGYLNVFPSNKAMKKEREKLREMTGPHQCYQPLPDLIRNLNRHLDGWANYFNFGYPRTAFREINWYVRERLKQHLRRRSQRSFRPPEGSSYYDYLNKMGMRYL